MKNINDDIIAAIATSGSKGAISIIRISGKGSIELVNSCFKGKNLTKVKANTINYGFIVGENKEIYDEVLVSVFKAPKSFTAEDTVEINCHGGLFITNKIYEYIILKGARYAEPGEFTKRAFLNGRIDLTQAEAVMDMIEAQNNNAAKLAAEGLQGFIYDQINKFRSRLLDIIAIIDVNIDYPEYEDVKELTTNEIKPEVLKLKNDIEITLEKSKNVKLLKDGINTVILGEPNVGKSSLLNSLIEQKKAIVTDIPGTTRDVVEAKMNIRGLTLNLIDTAGIHKTEDVVEKIGIEKSIECLEKADFVLFVLDGNKKMSKEEKELYVRIKNKPHIVIINKKDLGLTINLKDIDDYFILSTKSSEDIESLKDLISQKFIKDDIGTNNNIYLTNARQIEKLNLAYKAINNAIEEIENDVFIDMVEIELRSAWLYLGEITGESSTDNLLDELFSRFCLGK